jgi:hypothetical protein
LSTEAVGERSTQEGRWLSSMQNGAYSSHWSPVMLRPSESNVQCPTPTTHEGLRSAMMDDDGIPLMHDWQDHRASPLQEGSAGARRAENRYISRRPRHGHEEKTLHAESATISEPRTDVLFDRSKHRQAPNHEVRQARITIRLAMPLWWRNVLACLSNCCSLPAGQCTMIRHALGCPS